MSQNRLGKWRYLLEIAQFDIVEMRVELGQTVRFDSSNTIEHVKLDKQKRLTNKRAKWSLEKRDVLTSLGQFVLGASETDSFVLYSILKEARF